MNLIKNNLILFGSYLLICIISMITVIFLSPILDSSQSKAFVRIGTVIITLAICGICFICGKYIGYNMESHLLNFLSTILIVIFIIVSVLLGQTNITSELNTAMLKFCLYPVYLPVTLVTNIFEIKQMTSIVMFIFLPYTFITIGALTK